MSDREADLRHYAEHFGLLFEHMGTTPMLGRVLGWLMVCEPPIQSSADLARALGASKASISTSTRQLLSMDLIERVPAPGERGAFFRLEADAFETLIRHDLAILASLQELLAQGVGLLQGGADPRTEQLTEARELYAFLAAELSPLIDRFRALRAARTPE